MVSIEGIFAGGLVEMLGSTIGGDNSCRDGDMVENGVIKGDWLAGVTVTGVGVMEGLML